MAAKSNPGFQNGLMNFGAIHSLSETIPMANNFELINGSNKMVYSGNSSITSNNKPFKRAEFSVDWSYDEQKTLEEGLVKYAAEPYAMKYIRIASTLSDKTARDVALRCKILKAYRDIKQVRAEKKQAFSKLEQLQSNISRLNSEIDRLRFGVTQLSLCANPLSSSLRDLEAREAELAEFLATLGFQAAP